MGAPSTTRFSKKRSAHVLSFLDLAIPSDWPLLVGFDTGTYLSAAFTVFCPDPYAALTIAEFPNYRYVGGDIELLDLSNAEWARTVHAAYTHLRPGTTKVHGWVDVNSQFKREFVRYGLLLHGNRRRLEYRVEVTREYTQTRPGDPVRWYFAPWLRVLPYEMEHAHWPDVSTTGGRFERVKSDDHTLDCVEHVLSRRPRVRRTRRQDPETFLQRYLREHRRPDRDLRPADRHLGRL